VLFVAARALVATPASAAPATFTVNATGDNGDVLVGDGICDASTSTGVQCTLRAAIQESNVDTDTDVVNINLVCRLTCVPRIRPTSALPVVSQPIVIDGTTQARGRPLLSGELSTVSNGLEITAGNSTVKGLAVASFDFGIVLHMSGSNVVENNWVGVEPDGTAGSRPMTHAIFVRSASNTVRGNVVGYGTGTGVFLDRTTSNVVEQNRIGTNAAGTVDLGNHQGVLVFNATGNTVRSNVISGNNTYGVHIQYFGIGTNPPGNTIVANYIGTNTAGTAALGNTTAGIRVDDAGNQMIGGFSSSDRNVIAANGEGIIVFGSGGSGGAASNNNVRNNFIGTDVTGTADLGNVNSGIAVSGRATSTLIGNNVVSGNGRYGLRVEGSASFAASGTTVFENRIGTRADGSAALGNSDSGVWVGANATDTSIGNGNLISGNGAHGVHASGSRVRVYGNLIGTNLAGNAAIANARSGVRLDTDGSTVGGATAFERNLLSGNTWHGVDIRTGDTNTVHGNYIGTRLDGTGDLGNGLSGVYLEASNSNQIGGATPGTGNLVSGNDNFGVVLVGDANRVEGNQIGTRAGGAGAVPNELDGVLVEGNGNVVGGADNALDAANVIARNRQNGVAVVGTTDNAILRNSIHDNEQLGIDLGDDGLTPNDAGDNDSGANNQQNFPVLLSATRQAGVVRIRFRLQSEPNTTYAIRAFASAACDPSGNGEGGNYLGVVSLTTDAGGTGEVTQAFGGVGAGQALTATATDPTGNTSEFSACLTAPK
jgi:titin